MIEDKNPIEFYVNQQLAFVEANLAALDKSNLLSSAEKIEALLTAFQPVNAEEIDKLFSPEERTELTYTNPRFMAINYIAVELKDILRALQSEGLPVDGTADILKGLAASGHGSSNLADLLRAVNSDIYIAIDRDGVVGVVRQKLLNPPTVIDYSGEDYVNVRGYIAGIPSMLTRVQSHAENGVKRGLLSPDEFDEYMDEVIRIMHLVFERLEHLFSD